MNARRSKLYTCGEFGGAGIVSTTGDTMLAVLDFLVTESQWVCNEPEDKAYAGVRTTGHLRDSLVVVDCETDTIQTKVALDSSSYINWLALAPWSNRLYCLTSQGRLFAIDCATDSIVGVAEVPLKEGVGIVVSHPDNHRIYVVSYWDAAVYVFRDEPSPVAEQRPTLNARRLTLEALPNPSRGVIRLAAGLFDPIASATLSIFDCAGSLVRSYAMRNSTLDIPDLPAGVYLLRLATHSGRTATVRVTLLN